MKSVISPQVAACAQLGAPLLAAFVGLSLTAQVCGLGHASAPAGAAYARAVQSGFSHTDVDMRADLASAAPRNLDLLCLTDAVYYEARGESPAGQAAVAQVVLNRARSPKFPNSVCGVVFQAKEAGARRGEDCQFSFVCDGAMTRPKDVQAWNKARAVAARALDGYVMRAVGPALDFHVNEPGRALAAKPGTVAHLGRHVFFIALTRPLKLAPSRPAEPPTETVSAADETAPSVGDLTMTEVEAKPAETATPLSRSLP